MTALVSTGSVEVVVKVGGRTLSLRPMSRTGDADGGWSIALPAGKAGSLSTRTNNGAGVITLSAGHGILAADVVDIYWAGGVRYGVTIDSLSGTNNVNLNFDDTPAAAGDNLPAQATAVVVSKQVTINTNIDGDNLKIFGIGSEYRCHYQFTNAGNDEIDEFDLPGDELRHFCSDLDETNFLTGDPITTCKASCGDATNATTLEIIMLYDSTP